MIEMELIGVRVELPANQPIVLLKEKEGTRYLPIWIGAPEATAIAFALQGVETSRPLTHDLFVDVLEALRTSIESVQVVKLEEGTFFAELHLLRDGERSVVSARSSDSIALACRLEDVPIYAAEDVLDEVGLEIEEREDGEVEEGPDAEELTREFRQFLDEVTPEDFDTNG